MSLRCLGARAVRTTANTVLNGATAVSVSFWVKLNTGSDVPKSDALLVGKGGSNPFSAVILGGTPGTLRFVWKAPGTGVAVSMAEVSLAPGSTYHLASTTASGAQRYYLNGSLIKSEAVVYPASQTDVTGPAPFQVGPDVAGLDVTIDDPTVWQNYVLTPSDVVNIRDRIVHPEGVAAAQLAWGLSLDGAAGAKANAGSPGLADLGPARLPATPKSLPAPTFDSGVLTYTPFPSVRAAVIAGSGETLAVQTVDASGLPANVTSVTLGDVRLLLVTAAGGTFTVTLAGVGSVTVACGAYPSNVDGTSGTGTLQAALETLVGKGNVSVTGINPYRIVFATSQPTLTVDSTNLLASRPADPATAGVTAESTNSTFTNRRGTWAKVAGGWATGEHYDTPGGATGAEIRFPFTGLAAGNYRVLAGWPAGTGYATDAPYRVYDGATFIGLVRVNQSVPTESDKNVGGSYAAEAVGTFYCSSGTLTVVVADDANGKVAADAVCLQPADPAAAVVFGYNEFAALRPPGSRWGGASGLGSTTWLGRLWYNNTVGEFCYPMSTRGRRQGTYKAELNWNAGGDNDTVCPVDVTVDGATTTLIINEQLTPSGGSSYSDGTNTVPFYPLGTYPVSRSIGVQLTVPNRAGATQRFSALRITPVSFAASTVPAVVASVPSGGAWSYRVNGGPALRLTKSVWASDSKDRPYVAFALPAAVRPGDVVTLSAPGGALVTAAGSAPALSDVPVTNYAGSSPVPPVDMTAPRPMRMAWNLMAPGGANPATAYCDITKSMGGFYSPHGDPLTLNPAGYVTSGTGRSIAVSSTGDPLDPGGYRNAPAGTYTAFWSGTATVLLEEATGGSSVVAGPVTTIANGDKMRTFAVTAASGYNGLNLAVNVTGGSCLNLRVYLPGTAINTADGTAPVFRDEFLAKLAGAAALRAMQWYTPMFSSFADFSDYPAATDQAYSDSNRDRTIPVTSIAPYPNTEHYGSYIYVPCLVNCAAPHGLADGSVVTMSSADVPQIPRSDGGGIDLNGVSFGVYYNPTYMTTSQFVIFLNIVSNRPTSGTYAGSVVYQSSTITPAAGSAYLSRACGGPPAVFFGLCNRNGSDAWFNISTIAPGIRIDANVARVATLAATTLAPGRKFILEWSNETWNTGFTSFHWLTNFAAGRGLTPPAAYAMISNHFRAVARAAFVAAGRDPNDVVCYFNVQLGNPANAYGVIDYLKANSLPCDAIGGAPYWRIGPAYQTGVDYDALTAGQVVDLAELQTALMPDPSASLAETVRSYLDANGYAGTKLVAYEGGPEDCILGGTNLNQARHTRAWHTSPRTRGMLLEKYRGWQSAGFSMVCQYAAAFPYTPENTPPGTKCYTGFTAWDMQAGKGDASDGKSDNRVNPYLLTGKVSVVGQAFKEWNAAPPSSGGSSSGSTTPTARFLTNPNAQPALTKTFKPVPRRTFRPSGR